VTIDLPEDLIREAKQAAAVEHCTYSDFVSDALAEKLRLIEAEEKARKKYCDGAAGTSGRRKRRTG